MSRNRDKELDIENTKGKLKNLPVPTNGKKNWLGHSGGGAVIDEMLLKGVTLQDLARRQKQLIQEEGKGRKDEKSVRSHIDHLRDAHGLLISKIEGVYMFDYPTTSKAKENYKGIEQEKRDLEKKYKEQIKRIQETEKETIVSQRVGQNTLRKFLLQLYKSKCAMCDVDAVEVLRASHIVPWSEGKNIRLEPSNAILLCGLHDLAFDKGLIIINDDFSIAFPNITEGLRQVLKKITYNKLNLPKHEEYYPKIEYLQRHRNMNSNE